MMPWLTSPSQCSRRLLAYEVQPSASLRRSLSRYGLTGHGSVLVQHAPTSRPNACAATPPADLPRAAQTGGSDG